MGEIIRVSPREAREKVMAEQAHLICAYDSDEKYNRIRLEGSKSLSEFRSKADVLSKDQEIIFY